MFVFTTFCFSKPLRRESRLVEKLLVSLGWLIPESSLYSIQSFFLSLFALSLCRIIQRFFLCSKRRHRRDEICNLKQNTKKLLLWHSKSFFPPWQRRESKYLKVSWLNFLWQSSSTLTMKFRFMAATLCKVNVVTINF